MQILITQFVVNGDSKSFESVEEDGAFDVSPVGVGAILICSQNIDLRLMMIHILQPQGLQA